MTKGTIPSKDSTFHIEIMGELTKTQYQGEFTCKILNHKGRALVDKHRAFLNGESPNQLELETLTLHHRIAHLRYALTKFPNWWLESDLGYELYDSNVVTEVYGKVMQAEREWYRLVWGDEALAKLENPEPETDTQPIIEPDEQN